MKTSLTWRLLFLTTCTLLGHVDAVSGFASLLERDEGIYRFDEVSVAFDVFEVANGTLRELDEGADHHAIFKAIDRSLEWQKGFNTVQIQEHAAKVIGISSDVADSRAFFHCPVLPAKTDVTQMSLRTRSDFVQQLGKPSWPFDDFCFKGFFSIRNNEAGFCWFLLDIKTKRLFVGFSRRDQLLKPLPETRRES